MEITTKFDLARGPGQVQPRPSMRKRRFPYRPINQPIVLNVTSGIVSWSSADLGQMINAALVKYKRDGN